MSFRKITGIFIILVAVVTITALVIAGSNKQNDNSKLKVAASFYPLYEFAKQVGGDKIDATNITPVGAEPHDFEPSPQAIISAKQAKVFIYNGGTFEPWVDKFLAEYKNTPIKASNNITLSHNDTGRDPHFWLDPVLAQQIIGNIRDGLSAADPVNKNLYDKNAANYSEQLAVLDKDIKTGLQNCQLRTIITSHQAFSYFGNRYNINILPIAGIDPNQEPSAAKLAEVSQIVKDKNIKYIFFENLVSPRLAATIAQETGAQTAVLDPIEGISDEAKTAGKNYIAVQRDNLAALKLALACQ